VKPKRRDFFWLALLLPLIAVGLKMVPQRQSVVDKNIKLDASKTSLEWSIPHRPLRIRPEGNRVVFELSAGENKWDQEVEKKCYAAVLNRLEKLLPAASVEPQNSESSSQRHYHLRLVTGTQRTELDYWGPPAKSQAEIAELLDGASHTWGVEAFGAPTPNPRTKEQPRRAP
jgi:hypothetical protein